MRTRGPFPALLLARKRFQPVVACATEGALRPLARGASRFDACARKGPLRLLPAVLVLLMAGLGGCGNTPTLPLPPPTALVGAPDLQGLVTVQGDADEDAYVTVLNQQTDSGKITHAAHDGHYSLQIAASVGDKLVIWQEREGIAGERTEQTVPGATR